MILARTLHAAAITLASLAAPVPQARADAPQVVSAQAQRAGMGWRVDVTLQHPDTGWDHYADGWRIEDEAGNTLARRELMHPHVEEQPFTRSLFNVMLPDGIKAIWVRAHCSKSGWAKTRHKTLLAH